MVKTSPTKLHHPGGGVRVLTLVAAVALSACDVPDTSIVFLGIDPGTFEEEEGGGASCTYTGDLFTNRTIRGFDGDTQGEGEFAKIAAVFENRLTGSTVPGTEAAGAGGGAGAAGTVDIATNNRIVPLRFSYRWECDSNGFTNGLDTFFMPNFRPRDPFCVNERNEDQASVGFDVVAAQGSATEPGAIGFALMTVIPTQLGRGFELAYTIGDLADRCCRSDPLNGCIGAAANPTSDACTELQSFFNTIGGNYQVSNPADLIQWQPYAAYYNRGGPLGPAFPMRVRGQVEFTTSAGDIVQSNDVLHIIQTCVAPCGDGANSCSRLP